MSAVLSAVFVSLIVKPLTVTAPTASTCQIILSTALLSVPAAITPAAGSLSAGSVTVRVPVGTVTCFFADQEGDNA
jgi:hypothetical protein